MGTLPKNRPKKCFGSSFDPALALKIFIIGQKHEDKLIRHFFFSWKKARCKFSERKGLKQTLFVCESEEGVELEVPRFGSRVGWEVFAGPLPHPHWNSRDGGASARWRWRRHRQLTPTPDHSPRRKSAPALYFRPLTRRLPTPGFSKKSGSGVLKKGVNFGARLFLGNPLSPRGRRRSESELYWSSLEMGPRPFNKIV